MSKPTIFFSHSSHDQKSLTQLKELFTDKTGGAIDVFLSSDGQSIPLGRNWVYRVQEALENAALMVVFLTPSALRSHWILFESGFAYAKQLRVVPVGFLGVDLSTVRPPLGLLQGFNIYSADGLNNLIALANDEFDHKHSETFTDVEFQSLVAPTGAFAVSVFGEYFAFIDRLSIYIQQDELLKAPNETLDEIGEILSQRRIEFLQGNGQLNFHGVSVENRGEAVRVEIDPTIATVTLPWPAVENLIQML